MKNVFLTTALLLCSTSFATAADSTCTVSVRTDAPTNTSKDVTISDGKNEPTSLEGVKVTFSKTDTKVLVRAEIDPVINFYDRIILAAGLSSGDFVSARVEAGKFLTVECN